MTFQRDITIGNCRLIQGDCLDVLPHMTGVADLLFCDAAYELTSGGNAQQSMGGLFATDKYDNDGLLMDVLDWDVLGGPFYRACKPDADGYIMTNDKNLFGPVSPLRALAGSFTTCWFGTRSGPRATAGT
ncbi:MAG: hypothetical protein ACI8Q6_001968 [Granulosicoccus sp.]|jgi:hypothetical protein